MPVVSAEIIEDAPQVDGRRHVRFRYVFDRPAGRPREVIVGPMRVPPSFDAAAELAARQPLVEAAVVEQEVEEAVERVRQGEDPVAVMQGAVHAPRRRIARRLVRWLLHERDPRIVIWLEPLIIHLRTQYPDPAQLRSFLSLTVEQMQRLNRRVAAILDPVSGISPKDQIVAFAADAEVAG